MFRLSADRTYLRVEDREPLTSGSVNVNRAAFTFSADWTSLTKTAVFRAGKESRELLLPDTLDCAIPWEVLKKPGEQLYAGVYGTRGGELVLPTVWAHLGTVLEGAAPGENARPPTPDLWEQELEKKGDGLDYDGLTLSLTSGGRPISSVDVAAGPGGPAYKFGHGLKQEGLTVSVNSVDDFRGDNTLPMTAAGVQATVGNIEALLETI